MRNCCRLLHWLLAVLGLVADALTFLRLRLRSRSALAAENLFLRQQLALYLERKAKPPRATHVARVTLVLLSGLFDWKGALSIINNASVAGKIATGKDIPLGAYVASKHAVVGLTKQMGLELSSHQILVNCVCPGVVDTPMWDLIDREVARLEGGEVGSVKARAVASIPLGRIQQPEDVANLVVFLASSDARYITGQALNVCGGYAP